MATSGTTDKKRRDVWRKVLRYTLPLVVSAGLVLWLLHKVDYHKVLAVVREGCDFRWIAAMMVITTLSHIIRGIRWGIQLRAAGIPRMPVVAESVSIFGAYALNLVVSYLGEAWRCIYVSRREDAHLTTVVGTDLGDRISDAIVVALLVVLALVVAHPAMMHFLERYHVVRDLHRIASDPMVWIVLAAVVAAVWGVFYFCRKQEWMEKMRGGIRKIWDGFRVLFHMKGIGEYIVLTLGIWLCYFMETYCCFYAFPFTRELIHTPGLAWGLIPGLVVFVFGSCSIAIPSNGGLGPWNIAVMFALSLYGVSTTDGVAYSFTVWSFQTLMLIILGLFSAGYIAFEHHKERAAAA